jgi:chemotaxis protein methyltransferase CheR
VIFCRNVMIYFDDDMKNKCATLYHQQLQDDGTLFIGHSESLRNLNAKFEALPFPQGFAYKKG